MLFLAWAAIILQMVIVFGSPFLIGKPMKDYGAGGYLSALVQAIIVVALAGRVLGRW